MNKTPKLRFKAFSGDWNETNIGNEFKLSSGTTPSKSNKEYFNGSNCWITSGELKNKYINSTIDKITDIALKESNLKKYPIGTFVIAIYGLEASGTRGSCSILNTEATISQACMAFTPKLNTSNEFLYYWYMKYGEKIGLKYAQGTKQQNLSTDLVGNINISVPSKEEQEKIASFFSLIDDKTSLQSEKVDALKDYKKGIMQKIFSSELRFKDDDGRDYPEWEDKKLGTLFNIKAGGDIKSENVSKEITKKNIYPIYANALSNKGLYGYTDTFKVEGDTITVTGRGDIGYAIARNDRYYPIVRLLVLSPIENLNTIFFENIINVTNIFVESTGVPQLTSPQLSQVKVSVPVLKEQNKIAKLLKGIDIKIKKEKDKLDSLNEYKKGLLQQMFV